MSGILSQEAVARELLEETGGFACQSLYLLGGES